jgi:hypothetical protein
MLGWHAHRSMPPLRGEGMTAAEVSALPQPIRINCGDVAPQPHSKLMLAGFDSRQPQRGRLTMKAGPPLTRPTPTAQPTRPRPAAQPIKQVRP